MEELYRIKTEGHAEDAAIIQGEKYRFTVLTEEMLSTVKMESLKTEQHNV